MSGESLVIHSMAVSADGYVTDPDGGIDFTVPSEELHRFHNERTRSLGAHLLGRRLYETMLYWETIEQDPDAPGVALEFAALWRPLPKVVFSRTLEHVEGTARLAQGSVAQELDQLRSSVDGNIGVGGAELAAECIRLGVVDEFHVFVCPVVLGGGTPFFPRLDHRIELDLVETRTFDQTVLLRYRVARS